MEVVLVSFDFCFSPQSLAGFLAYIDPGTGSLVFQVVAASLISAGLFVTGVRDRIVWLVIRAWRSKPQPTADATENGVRSDRAHDLQVALTSPAAPHDQAPRKVA